MKTNKTLTKFALIFLILLLIQSVFISKLTTVNNVLANECISNEHLLKEEITLLKNEIRALENELKQAREVKELLSESNYLGEFTITHYTAGFESTGKNPGDKGYGITRSGTTVKEGRTIAADWLLLPKNSVVYIEGYGIRVVEDTGSAINGKDIDIYIEDLETARQLGVKQAKVYLIELGEN
jgi:3D (Asp-Asp-Asp) domain-containing protein